MRSRTAVTAGISGELARNRIAVTAGALRISDFSQVCEKSDSCNEQSLDVPMAEQVLDHANVDALFE